jgi:hypothetical protein
VFAVSLFFWALCFLRALAFVAARWVPFLRLLPWPTVKWLFNRQLGSTTSAILFARGLIGAREIKFLFVHNQQMRWSAAACPCGAAGRTQNIH